MSDPIRDLENFDSEGLAVTPPSPSEVRRQGDRLRRRRNAAAAIAGVAAIVVIATPIALFAGVGDHRSDDLDPAPQPSVTTDVTPGPLATIPDDFPIIDHFTADDVPEAGGEVIPGGELAKELEYCGKRPLATVKTVDALSVRISGGESSEERTLLLFRDAAAAASAETALLESAAACPRVVDGDFATDNRIIRASSDWPGRTVEQKDTNQRLPAAEATYDFLHVVRAGHALLLSSSFWGAEGVAVDPVAGLSETRSSLAPQIQAMEAFGEPAQPADPTTASTGRQAGATEIPKDFPLNREQENIEDGSTPTPTSTGDGVLPVELCGAKDWPTNPVDRLLSKADAPEHLQWRELVTFEDAATAVQVMASIRKSVRDCPKEPTTGPGGESTNWVHRELAVDPGYDSVTWSRAFEGGLVPGLRVYQLVRVGNAILALSLTTEGTQSGGMAHTVELTAYSRDLAGEMCVFTKAGC